MRKLRSKIQSFYSGRPGRWGLFTAQPPLAIGETKTYGGSKRKFALLTVSAKRGEGGEVLIAPKNILTSPIKKGHTDKILF
jgi:hypothetical protein